MSEKKLRTNFIFLARTTVNLSLEKLPFFSNFLRHIFSGLCDLVSWSILIVVLQYIMLYFKKQNKHLQNLTPQGLFVFLRPPSTSSDYSCEVLSATLLSLIMGCWKQEGVRFGYQFFICEAQSAIGKQQCTLSFLLHNGT